MGRVTDNTEWKKRDTEQSRLTEDIDRDREKQREGQRQNDRQLIDRQRDSIRTTMISNRQRGGQ